MNITFFDIETYAEFFCFCAICCDYDTEKELWRKSTIASPSGVVDGTNVADIVDAFGKSDFIVSYNGSRFDLPILAKVKHDVAKMGQTHQQYIHADGEQIIGYDDNNHALPIIRHNVKEWSQKHFDMLNNCLLGKSLKQWEMYCNLPIKELPYSPYAKLTPEMKQEILEYCFHDCWALGQVFWRFGSGKKKSKYYTLPSRIEVMKMWPENLVMKFDRTTQALSAGIIYQTNTPIAPRTMDPLELFKLDEFDVPDEVKNIFRLLAKSSPMTAKGKKELAEECCYKGIQFGKGGCHYIKKGHHKKIFCFDVQSEYPRVIRHWSLLKTPQALENWSNTMQARFAMKNKKGTPEYHADIDAALKVVLNSLSGGFRIRGGGSVAFDPAAGEAMCFIGQLVVTELALACPNWDDVIEINTDSVFVVGEENAKALRKKCDQMLEKYDMLFEEEFMEQAYFRDVNNYGIFDADGKLLDGRGLDYSDATNKNHEKAVVYELFRNLLLPKLDLDWSRYEWTDFIYKYHKSAASKYATINGEPMTHKNYYFMWTTTKCPNASVIRFSNDLMDSRNGSIKPRYGVYAFSIEELEQYKEYIDYSQYQRDLDENFYLWGREDLITTFVGNAKERKAKGLKIKSLADAFAQLHPWTEQVPSTVSEGIRQQEISDKKRSIAKLEAAMDTMEGYERETFAPSLERLKKELAEMEGGND